LWDGTLGDAEADRLLLLLLLTGGSSSATASADRLLLVGSKAVITVTAPCHQPLAMPLASTLQVALRMAFHRNSHAGCWCVVMMRSACGWSKECGQVYVSNQVALLFVFYLSCDDVQ
jgi:hypothetical protein